MIPRISRNRLLLLWSVPLLVAAVCAWALKAVLLPFALAAMLAYALHPALQALHRRGLPRALAAVLVEGLALLALALVLLLMVPVLARELPLIKSQLPLLLDRAEAALGPLLGPFGITLKLDVATLKAWLVGLLESNEDWAGTLLDSARLGGSALMALLGHLILVPVVVFYLLLDWPRLVGRLHDLVPPRLRVAVQGFLGECDALLGQYLRGQLLVMLAMALYYAVALAVVGLDLALPVGLFTGLAMAVPYLGYGLGLLLALLTALLQFAAFGPVAAVLLAYAIGQLLESFILTPRLVGERIGLGPLAVIFALMAFGQLFGFLGVLLALPAAAVTAVALRHLEARYRSSVLYTSAAPRAELALPSAAADVPGPAEEGR
ncbi:MAG: hypothetical protein RLY78_1716 [Pseudomonadota bacterium]|jgi:predicted PurR-regulated permease PerM